MRVSVIAIGRVKQPGVREACEHYERRIRHYLHFEIREIRTPGRGASDAIRARHAEGRALLAAIPNDSRPFALSRGGGQESSEAFAARLAQWLEDARDVALLIGGAHGLDQRVLDRTEGSLSLSPMTFSHDLARLVLFEQVYRACTILRGEPYHKGLS